MKFFVNYLKRRAIKKIARKLRLFLRRTYGQSKKYTSGQVRTAVERTGCNMAYACFGYAMFCSRDDFNQVHAEMGEPCDYDFMHQEVADVCFRGNTDFETSDLGSFSSGYGNGDVGGGFDAGGGGNGD